MNAAAQVSPMRKLFALLGVTIGAAGFTASLTGAYLGMRDFMASGNAFCASGGPYEIATECPQGVALLGASMFGLFVFWGVFAAVTAWAGGPVLASSLLMWGLIFGLLGWNLMQLGVFDTDSGNVVWGWAISGGAFWFMALGGLVPAAIMAMKSFTSRDGPVQSQWSTPVVRATAQAPTASPSPAMSPSTVPARLVLPPDRSEQ